MEEKSMHTNNTKLETFTVSIAWGFAFTVGLLLLIGLLLLVFGFVGSSFAQDAQPVKFPSAADASNALFKAAHEEDEPALQAILGAGKEVTSSNNELEDTLEREQFSRKYQEMHRLVTEADGSTVLYIGAENWPFPIPLVSKDGAWYFDSKTGTQEILFRRIGENEAVAIQVCEEFAITKKEQDVEPVSYDPITRFAQDLVVAGSTTVDTTKESLPFHGYYFRTLTGDPATGTSRSLSGSEKRRAVVLVAYPANYRSSGVETFIVSQGGIVFEKDLGPNTTTTAPSIKTRTSSWGPAE
jgi:Protein of unknown function (DUF2950)